MHLRADGRQGHIYKIGLKLIYKSGHCCASDDRTLSRIRSCFFKIQPVILD
jgi:hypothetical protein